MKTFVAVFFKHKKVMNVDKKVLNVQYIHLERSVKVECSKNQKNDHERSECELVNDRSITSVLQNFKIAKY